MGLEGGKCLLLCYGKSLKHYCKRFRFGSYCYFVWKYEIDTRNIMQKLGFVKLCKIQDRVRIFSNYSFTPSHYIIKTDFLLIIVGRS